MPRRKRDAVAERANQMLEEKAEHRRGRKAKPADAQDQAKPKRATRADKAAKERKPRVHADLLTVAYRGPLAGKFREMAEQCKMSLARLLQDALLAYETCVAAGYRPGTALAEWKARQTGDTDSA